MRIPYSYLEEQFADLDGYLEDIRCVIKTGDFTLGAPVAEFEGRFAQLTGIPYCVSTSSGTDALILSLKMLGVGPGDEVITSPNTFVATVGAIAMTGARPVFVDNNEDYTIDEKLIEQAITTRTKAILPVHLTGRPADMPAIMEIAGRHNLVVVEDAAQAILASIDGMHVGSWGHTAAFSLHPLKNLNVWGDGGVIVTRSSELNDRLRMFRNHGLVDRDRVEFFEHNCRLDTLQAVVANRLMEHVTWITDRRISNAQRFNRAFADLGDFVTIPQTPPDVKQVFHTYVIQVKDRQKLLPYLLSNGIEAKVHYPIPLHLQNAARYLGYNKGDFPVCERHCETIVTLPVHQHLEPNDIDYMIDVIYRFYKK